MTVVTIDAFVHRDRVPITDLTAADFVVRDNGVEQRITSMGTTSSAHVVIGLDLSESVDGDVLGRLRQAVRSVVGELTRDDRISLFTFADRLRLLAEAQVPDATVAQVVDRAEAVGKTTLHDALVMGTALARAEAGGRPVVFVLFTDGRDTASWSSASQVLDVLRRTDVVVYPVGAGLPRALIASPASAYFEHRSWLEPTAGDTLRLLQSVAEVTGGEFLRVDRDSRLDVTFGAILEQYRQRYVLSFTPEGVPQPGWHRLDVRLRNRPGTVVAREGYMAQ